MSKLDKVFKEKAFIAFLTAGDPSLEDTKRYIYKMIEAGVSLIEIGIPFSDPIAEGKTIFDASMRALKSNTTLDKIFDMVYDIREKYEDFPLVFMTYLNPVFRYGYERFFSRCNELNIYGVIIPDLPYEEKKEVSDVADKYDLDVISMITPTSNERIEMIAKEAKGFIYLVSSLGVTGVRSEFNFDLAKIVNEIKKYTNTKIAIGFGISNENQVKDMIKISDGVIVGSAIVNIIAKYKDKADDYVYDFCKSMVLATK